VKLKVAGKVKVKGKRDGGFSTGIQAWDDVMHDAAVFINAAKVWGR